MAFIKVSKVWRWSIGIVFSILIIFFIVQYLMVQSIDPILEEASKTAIKSATKGVYRIEYDDFTFNPASTTLTINGLKLIPDTAKYLHLLEQDSIGPNLYHVSVPELKIRRINLISMILTRSLNIHELILKSPSVEVINHPQAIRDTTEAVDLKDLFSGELKSISVSEIILKDMKLNYQVKEENAPPPFIVNNINFRLFNLNIDSLSLNDPDKLLYTDDFEFKIYDFTYKLPDSLNIIKVKELGLSQSEAKIYMEGFQHVPRYKLYKYAKKVGIQTDRISVSTERIELSHINMPELLSYQNISAGLLTVSNTDIEVFRDKRYPENTKRRPKMPHQAIKDLNFYFKLDTIKVVKANIKYIEHGEDSKEVGEVAFNSLYASIYGLTNDSLLIKKQPLIADVQTLLYNNNLLKANLVLNIGHPRGKFDLKGSLTNMDLKDFNNFLLPVAHVNIENGKLHKAEFTVSADDVSAKGKMVFHYDDLKIKVLDKDGEAGLKQKITSFVANTFVVKKSNPGSGGFREGNISYTRDISKSIFHFWGRIILTGVASSVGISEKAMNKNEAEANTDLMKEGKRNRKS